MSDLSRTLLCLVLFVGMAPVSGAANQDRRGNATLDEVLVHGRAVKLDELRQQVIALEDKFYERYNDVNQNDDFDINCIMEAKTGTRFVKRSCRPAYQEAALREEGKTALISMQDVLNQVRMGNPNPSVLNSPPVPATVMIEARLPEYKENMRRVLTSDVKLQEIVKERAETIALYETAQSLLFKKPQSPIRIDSEMPHSTGPNSDPTESPGHKEK